MCEKPLSALCTEKSNIKKSCKALKSSGCITTEFLSGKKCNMQPENQNLSHIDIKNKNFLIKFDECVKAESEKLITQNFNSLPLFYYVSDSENEPGKPVMECPLRQPISGSNYYHYHHIPDQTKSLQELQNEVGALLEFRNLVIETFPDLKSKMASMSVSHTLTESSVATSPFVSRLEWEPGIRIKRKLVQLRDASSSIFAEGGSDNRPINAATNHVELLSSSLPRSRSNSHSCKKDSKNIEGNGSVIIQDSGFSTETSSSKEAHSASSATGPVMSNRLSGNELDDELLNLLDVIHRKSNKIRDEIECLQTHKVNKTLNNDESTILSYQFTNKCNTKPTLKTAIINQNFDVETEKLNKEDVKLLRKERDELFNKLAEMEAEILTGNIRIAKIQKEVAELTTIKNGLEEHLKLVLNPKLEIDCKLQEFYKYNSGFTNSFSSQSDTIIHPQCTSTPVTNKSLKIESKYSANNDNVNTNSATTIVYTPLAIENDIFNKSLAKSYISKNLNTFHSDTKHSRTYNTKNLGHLDGFISEPYHLQKQRTIDSKKISAILKENNVIELQRHLLTLTVQNQILTKKLEQSSKSKIKLNQKLEKSKEDIDDLHFQVEEKKIELEGTKAQLRVLKLQVLKTDTNKQNTISSIEMTPTLTHDDTVLSTKTNISEQVFDTKDIYRQISTPSMKAMTPFLMEDVQYNSSSTESAQDHNEDGTSDTNNIGISIASNVTHRCEKVRPPSKIPLPDNKLLFSSPKPPSGNSSNIIVHTKSLYAASSSSMSNKYLCRSTGNLNGKSPKSLNRPNSAQSLRKDNSLLNLSRTSTSSIPVSNTHNGGNAGVAKFMTSSINQMKFNPSQQTYQLKQKFNSKFTNNSPTVKHKREHMSSSRARNLDSLSKNNQNNYSTLLSSAHSSNKNNSINTSNNSRINKDKNFLNSSSTNLYKLNNNAKTDASFNSAQTDNNMSLKLTKPNTRRMSSAGRRPNNNPITELQHLQLPQKPQSQFLLQQTNNQSGEMDNGKVRNLRSTVLGWLKF